MSSQAVKSPHFLPSCFDSKKVIAGTTHKSSSDRAGLYRELGVTSGNAVGLAQCHGDRIEWVNEGRSKEISETDALVTNKRGLLLTIRTADCFPVFLFDPVTQTIALVHAGWRGARLGIVAKTVSELQSQAGTKPSNLIVALGPAIRVCCYEFDPHAVPEFQPFFRGCYFDLSAYLVRELKSKGVLKDSIFDSGLCTCCQPDDFHSYRRDKENRGRMLSFMMLV